MFSNIQLIPSYGLLGGISWTVSEFVCNTFFPKLVRLLSYHLPTHDHWEGVTSPHNAPPTGNIFYPPLRASIALVRVYLQTAANCAQGSYPTIGCYQPLLARKHQWQWLLQAAKTPSHRFATKQVLRLAAVLEAIVERSSCCTSISAARSH